MVSQINRFESFRALYKEKLKTLVCASRSDNESELLPRTCLPPNNVGEGVASVNIALKYVLTLEADILSS